MGSIGILAYGSLVDDPGDELKPLIAQHISEIKTPFPIEFARKSRSRDNAPTVVPVEDGGAAVLGTILVLEPAITREHARDLLWRRETRNEGTNKHYTRPSVPGQNSVLVEEVFGLSGIETVLYTKIGSNIDHLSASILADLAIASARAQAGRTGKDGISYLIAMKRHGITTPLRPRYESEILRKTRTANLEEALNRCRTEGL